MLQIVRTFPNICPHRIFSLQTPREGQGVLLGQNPPLYPPLSGITIFLVERANFGKIAPCNSEEIGKKNKKLLDRSGKKIVRK